MAQQFDFNPSFVLSAITSRYFQVPQYQRSYSWEEQQLEDFWSDMNRSISDGGEYFLGSFVLSNEDSTDYFSIIDGQQRIATTTILLACMRDAYNANDRAKLGISIDTQFLQQHDVETDEYRRRIKMNAIDDPFYVDRIINKLPTEPQKDSHRRIALAQSYFAERLQQIIVENPQNWGERFATITRYLSKQARVVVVETATDADAFTIFETLNDRGADLTIADLLKNYLFSRSKGEIEAVRQYWFEAVTILENVQNEKEFVSFLRQLWSSYNGVTRERDLYRSIKDQVQSPASAVKFAKQIRDGAQIYRAMLSSDSEYWNVFDKKTRDHVAILGGLNLQQVRPLLLSVLSTMPQTIIVSVIKNLTSWAIRGIVAGNTGGGQVERYFSDAAVQVRSGKIKDAADLIASLSPVVPNDSVFKNAFGAMRITKNSQARYYLCAIEKFMRGEIDPELILNEEAKEVNLEHILPQKRSPNEWKEFTDDEASAYAYRLGNMTLLRRSDNQKLGNGEWGDKRIVLATSKIKLNAQIADIANWDKDSIDLRQNMMSDLAVQVWPRLS